ncbi:hypothetical protein Bca101_067675 [Brassica carinata]
MIGFDGLFWESAVLRSDQKMGRTCGVQSVDWFFSIMRCPGKNLVLRKEGAAVRVLTWWDLVRISWILVRICPEQAHDCSYLIVIDDSKTLRLVELHQDLLAGELGVKSVRWETTNAYQMRSVLLEQGGINLLVQVVVPWD